MDDVLSRIDQRIGNQLTAETMGLLNGEQITLWAYRAFRTEMLEGGMVQLIHNGYGPFIFENPFAKAMRLWGLKAFSNFLYDARKLYEKHRKALTRPCSDEEFMALYEDHPEMEETDDAFVEEEPIITTAINEYVKNNKDIFLAGL